MSTPQKKYSLPDMTHSFKISVRGAETHHEWTGSFKYKRPSLGDRSRIDAMRARLSGDLETLTGEVQDFIEAVSHLRFTLDEYPDWWSELSYGLDMHDGNVISEIYNRCLDFEATYRERMFSGKKEDVEEKSDEFDNGNFAITKEAIVTQTLTPSAGEARI